MAVGGWTVKLYINMEDVVAIVVAKRADRLRKLQRTIPTPEKRIHKESKIYECGDEAFKKLMMRVEEL